jgi:hypothetical protein
VGTVLIIPALRQIGLLEPRYLPNGPQTQNALEAVRFPTHHLPPATRSITRAAEEARKAARRAAERVATLKQQMGAGATTSEQGSATARVSEEPAQGARAHGVGPQGLSEV